MFRPGAVVLARVFKLVQQFACPVEHRVSAGNGVPYGLKRFLDLGTNEFGV